MQHQDTKGRKAPCHMQAPCDELFWTPPVCGSDGACQCDAEDQRLQDMLWALKLSYRQDI